MKWEWNTNATLMPAGWKVLIKTTTGLFLAGTSQRNKDGGVEFRSSDDSWTVPPNAIEKWIEIQE